MAPKQFIRMARFHMGERMNNRSQTQLATTPSLSPVSGGVLQRQCTSCGNHTMAGGECQECGKKKNGLQRKLTIGASNDPLELEADRIADQVMAAPANPAVSSALLRIQRYTGQVTEHSDAAPASVDRVLASSGSPLEVGLRQDMESRFGHDFSQVRIHSGATAEQSAREVNAKAYTVGHNVVFGVGQFVPRTQEGQRLIAHELTHVMQQGNQAATKIQRQQAITSPCPGVVASTTYSRGNDDWAECNYETARIKVDLVLDPCSCGSMVTAMPLSINYSAILEGKSFTGRTIPNPSGSGRIPEQEGQASHIATGVTTPGRSTAGPSQPGMALSEDNLPRGTTPNTSGPLILNRDDSTRSGRPGDPGDTVSQRLSVGSVSCVLGAKTGQVSLGGGFQVINYDIVADSTGVRAAAITLTESGRMQGRIPTPLINVTGGGTPYLRFPGIPRPGGTGCTCNTTTGVQTGAGCTTGPGGAGFGRGRTP